MNGAALHTALLTEGDIPANDKNLIQEPPNYGDGTPPASSSGSVNSIGIASTRQTAACQSVGQLIGGGSAHSGTHVTAYADVTFTPPDGIGGIEEHLNVDAAAATASGAQLAALGRAITMCSPYTVTGIPSAVGIPLSMRVISTPPLGNASLALTESATVNGATRTVGMEIIQVGVVTVTLFVYNGPGIAPIPLLPTLAATAVDRVRSIPGVAGPAV